MGLPGKPEGIDGGEVERYFLEGKIKEIADYCETDIVNTYRVWLRYELFRGQALTDPVSIQRAKARRIHKAHGDTKQHLAINH